LSVCRSDVSSEDDADDTGIRGRAIRDDLLLFTNDFVVNVRPDDEHGASRYEHDGLLLYVMLVVVENRGVLGHVYEDANSIFFLYSMPPRSMTRDRMMIRSQVQRAHSSLSLFSQRVCVCVCVCVCKCVRVSPLLGGGI